MSLAFQRVMLANDLALKGGVKIVRDILATTKAPLGWTTEELYKLALAQPAPPDYFNPHIAVGEPFPSTPPPTNKRPNKKGKEINVMPGPPNPEHPVRSKVFLKKTILPFLEGSKELVKTRVERELVKATIVKMKKSKRVPAYPEEDLESNSTVKEIIWVWKAVDQASSNEPSKPREAVPREAVDQATVEPPKPTPPKPTPSPPELYGVAVEDISHLNRKRQKARREDVRREAHMVKVMEGIARARERSAAGVKLRAMQAQQKELREKRLALKAQNPDPLVRATHSKNTSPLSKGFGLC